MLGKLFNKELLLTTAIRFGSIGVGILLIRYFSGVNDIEEWGRITMVLGYSTVIMLLTQFGQGTNMLNQLNVSNEQVNLVQTNSLILSSVPVLIGVFCARYLPDELVLALLVSPIFVWYRNFSQFYQRKENNKLLFSILNQEAYVPYVLAMTLLVCFNFSIPLSNVLKYSLLFLAIFPGLYFVLLSPRIWKSYSLKSGFNNLRVSSPFFIASGTAVILSWMDTLMLGNLQGDEEVGLYNGIFKISSLITIALSLLNSYVTPRIRKAYTEGMDSLKELVKPYNRIGLLLSVIAYAGIFFLGEFIFSLMQLPFEKELFSSLLILAFGYVVNAGVGNVGFLLQLTDNQKVYNKIVFLALVLNIGLNLFLIPDYGILGASLASAITMSVWNVLSFIAVRVKLGFSPI